LFAIQSAFYSATFTLIRAMRHSMQNWRPISLDFVQCSYKFSDKRKSG